MTKKLSKRGVIILSIAGIIILLLVIFCGILIGLANTGKIPLEDINRDNVESVTISTTANGNKAEFNAVNQEAIKIIEVLRDTEVYITPPLIFGTAPDTMSGTAGIFTIKMKNGDIHYVSIDGKQEPILKRGRGYYFLIIDGKRYDNKERAAYYELVGIIKKNLK